jgi:phosphatidate phosphatase APP1
VLGPGNGNGISSQILPIGGADDADGKTINCTSTGDLFPNINAKTRFADRKGWGVISDIDDTVKKTMTPSPTGILKSTFADVPEATPGMEEFYKVLNVSTVPNLEIFARMLQFTVLGGAVAVLACS